MPGNEECKHGMNPEWCANCKGLLTPEEEETKGATDIEDLVRKWTK